MTRKRLLVLAVLAAALLLFAAAIPSIKQLAQLRGGDAMPVFEVASGEFVRQVHAEGNLKAVRATPLSPPPGIRGSVRVAWLAPDGLSVSEGDVVIRFDPTDMEKNLLDGKSDRAAAESRMTQRLVREEGAMRNLGRDADLAAMDLEHAQEFQSRDAQVYSRQEIIESEIDSALANHRKQHAGQQREARGELARVEQDLLGIERHKAELQITRAESELEQLEVRAPHDGTFVIIDMFGRRAELGSMVWPGRPIAEIPRLDEMEARVYVLEADAGGLKTGLSAEVVLDAHPGRSFPATIKTVEALAQPRSRRSPVQYFAVLLELERTDPEIMKPGQRVQATLLVEQRADVLTVPRQAVVATDDGDVVFVRRGDGFEAVAVKLGSAGLGRVVIESGIDEGDVVALRDPARPALDLLGPGGGGSVGQSVGGGT